LFFYLFLPIFYTKNLFRNIVEGKRQNIKKLVRIILTAEDAENTEEKAVCKLLGKKRRQCPYLYVSFHIANQLYQEDIGPVPVFVDV